MILIFGNCDAKLRAKLLVILYCRGESLNGKLIKGLVTEKHVSRHYAGLIAELIIIYCQRCIADSSAVAGEDGNLLSLAYGSYYGIVVCYGVIRRNVDSLALVCSLSVIA